MGFTQVAIQRILRVILLSWIGLFIPLMTFGQNELLKFKHLSLENGLSQSSITCIFKDSRGFMWFGTEDGLNKYDGTNFTTYRHVPNNENSLSSSVIYAITEHEDGFLWIGTNNGLNYFNPNNEKFTRYLQDSASNQILGRNRINALLLCADGNLLIGTGKGLYAYHPKTGISKYKGKNASDQKNILSLKQDEEGFVWVLSSDMLEKIKLQNEVLESGFFKKPFEYSLDHTMHLDSLNIWIGTANGLVKLNIENESSEVYRFYGSAVSPDSRDKILSIVRGQKGKLLLGSFGGGLIDFDTLTNKFQTILHDPNSRASLNSNLISSLFLDKAEILWVGTYGGGINKYDPGQFKFEHYKNKPGDHNSLSNNLVRALLLDSGGELWVGTQGGLNRIDRETGQIKVYKYDPNDLSTISSGIVRALQEDSYGNIWAGTWFNGLNSFDKRTGKFKRYINLPGRRDSIGQVRALETDDKGNIWFGRKDLWKFNPKLNRFKSYSLDDKNNSRLGPKGINCLYFDKTGLLWIGRQNGLKSLDTIANRSTEYLHNPQDTLSIGHNYITSIAEDRNGTLWFGTYGGGINKLNASERTFQRYNTNNGLLNDVIYGILVDKQGFIWFTSNAGLGRFDPNREEFKYFGVNHGIQSEEFNAGAYFKSKKGELFFGGINGFNTFYPENINNKKETSRIVFTDFQLLDDKKTSVEKVLHKHISRTEHIDLEHDQNTFAISFAELNYSENVDNTYEYQLEGIDDKWQLIKKEQKIVLGSLKPGKYELNVRIHNDLTKKTSIGIAIAHPIWQTKPAYLLYVLLVFLIVYLVYKNVQRTRQIRKQFELKIQNWDNKANTRHSPKSNKVDGILSNKQLETTSRNQKFLERVVEIVENHLEDSAFDVEKFAGEMFMSRSQLHRKLKATTGYSATEFIRLIRLKKAAQMLKANSGTVSEIAYKVGFENIGYFSKCFKDVYGKPPSQYKGSI